MSVVLYPPVDNTNILSSVSNPISVDDRDVESLLKRLLTEQKITNKHFSKVTNASINQQSVEN